MSGMPWRLQDDELRRRWEAGEPVDEIAGRLGRSVHAIRARAQKLKLPPRKAARGYGGPRGVTMLPPDVDQTAMRRCLAHGCGRKFKSNGPGHRICDRCKPSFHAAAVGIDIARSGEPL